MSLRCCHRNYVVTVFGLILACFGFAVYLNWIKWFTILRGKEMALSATSRSYPGWKTSPFPLYLDIYLFNWTNPEDFTNHSIKPRFEELGPYRFRDDADKVNIVFHPHNNSVTFRKKSVFYFDANGSKGSLSDHVTTVNMVAWAAAYKKRDSGFFQKRSLEALLSIYGEEISVTKTADELLFSGYTDPIVDLGSKFFSSETIPYDRVGYFYMRNGSTDFNGLLNMFTGGDSAKNLGKIHSWNYKTHNGYFKSHCGMINGSLGEFFPPNLKEGDSIELYPPNMCRTIPLDYSETVQIHGVKALKFSAGRRSVDNGTLYPETKCFCVNDQCERFGVINMAPCQFSTTTFVTYPHFYEADPYYLEQIEGLNPVKEKHEFFFTLEPNSGIPLEVGGGFQVNVLLESIPGIGIYEDIPRILLPLMWCEERVRLSPEMVADIAVVPAITYWGQVAAGMVTFLGLIILFWFPIHAIKTCYTPKDQRKHLPQKDVEMHQIKTEHLPFLPGKEAATIVIRPQKLPKLGSQPDVIQR